MAPSKMAGYLGSQIIADYVITQINAKPTLVWSINSITTARSSPEICGNLCASVDNNKRAKPTPDKIRGGLV
jgi:hypothetical protein